MIIELPASFLSFLKINTGVDMAPDMAIPVIIESFCVLSDIDIKWTQNLKKRSSHISYKYNKKVISKLIKLVFLEL